MKKTNNWRDNKIIRSIFDYLRYYKWKPSFDTSGVTLFASNMPYIKMFKKAGKRVEILQDVSVLWEPHNFKIKDELFKNFPIEMRILNNRRLVSRLYAFINQIVPKIFAYADYYTSYFKRHYYAGIIFNRRNKLCHSTCILQSHIVILLL